MELVKHLLFNLSLLLVLLLFVQIGIEKNSTRQVTKWRMFIYFSLAVLLCLLFSKEISNQIRVDLREIPLILGGLYFGIGTPIACMIIVIRAFMGINHGFWITLGVYILLSIIVEKLHVSFFKKSIQWRLKVSILLSILIPVLFMICYILLGEPIQRIDAWIVMILVPTIGTAIIAYTFESIYRNLIIRDKVVKAQKLEAVSHMGAAFSHEIRNPITVVKGFLQLIGEDQQLQNKTKEYVHISIMELNRAERVIKDYLTFAKPSLEVIEEMDIHREINHVLMVLEPLCNMNTIDIERIYGPIGMIQGDKHKIHQCFINIFKNSIEAMPTGGKLTIQTEINKTYIHIKITDTGMGMTENEISRLGEPFYTTKEAKGTGLGLMVSYSIIRAMNGMVRASSQKGKGTTFTISFPQYLPWGPNIIKR